MGGLLGAIDTAAKGLIVQRMKMNVVSENIANAETTHTVEGGPYRRQRVVVSAENDKQAFNAVLDKAATRLARTNDAHFYGKERIGGDETEVTLAEGDVVEDPSSSYRLVYDPSHPDADEQGYVKMPDIEVINEMVDMMAASRSYEANVSVISSAKKMIQDTLEI